MQLQPISTLLQQRMNRQEFLRTVGLLLLTVIGLGMLIKQPGAAKNTGTTSATTASQQTYGS